MHVFRQFSLRSIKQSFMNRGCCWTLSVNSRILTCQAFIFQSFCHYQNENFSLSLTMKSVNFPTNSISWIHQIHVTQRHRSFFKGTFHPERSSIQKLFGLNNFSNWKGLAAGKKRKLLRYLSHFRIFSFEEYRVKFLTHKSFIIWHRDESCWSIENFKLINSSDVCGLFLKILRS